MAALTLACAAEPLAPGEANLGPIEHVVDAKARAVWPGLTRDDGSRYIRHINGFFDGTPTGCWFFGLSSRATADVFVFCRAGDKMCPFDAQGRAQWSHMAGDPVFARMPGETGYSPYWLVWVVTVPADYRAGDLKSVEGINKAKAAGRVQVDQLVFDHGGTVGPGVAVMHCALVLAGTTLERAGGDVVGQPGVAIRPIEDRLGWHKQYRVHFYDFTASEGVGPADASSQSRPMMIVSDLFVIQRDCAGGTASPLCTAGIGRAPVGERDVDIDFTHDGDKFDTNYVLMANPFKAPADPADAGRAYSPLWRVSTVLVRPAHDAEVPLIDTTGNQSQSSIKSVADLRAAIAKGIAGEPEAMTEAATGAIPGNDGHAYFSCPSQVPWNAP